MKLFNKNICSLHCSILLKFCFVILVAIPVAVPAQEIINLYKNEIPNSKTIAGGETNTGKSNGMFRKVITPTLEIYLPQKENASGAAVIICPGGSYKVIVYDGEGIANAKEFAKNGVAAFVLKYRLPEDSLQVDKKIAPLQDAQQAIKLVRENAAAWGIDPNKIGIAGFSAGGHLAATVATHFKKSYIENKNNTSLRPDFLIVVYPVISMQDNLTHADSRRNLLGSNPSKEIIDD
ncbi:MAG: alpha/beta hydrolase, partial [Ferruginibacter sp.]